MVPIKVDAMTNMDPKRLSAIERINVIGTSGSGKSTFGRNLAGILGFPFIEMDALYWKPNWQEPTDEEFESKVKAATEDSHWVLDGNYSRTTSIKWRHVQQVVWLDMSFVRTVFQVTKRCIKRSLNQTEFWPGTGNRETLRKAFLSRESVILWSISSYGRNRRRYSRMMQSPEFSHIWFVRLKSTNGIRLFLEAARIAPIIVMLSKSQPLRRLPI